MRNGTTVPVDKNTSTHTQTNTQKKDKTEIEQIEKHLFKLNEDK